MSVTVCNESGLDPRKLLEPGSLNGPPRTWWVLHTKPRHEKALARHLRKRGIPYFLPLIDRSAVSRGRPVTTRVPLFPGYVFLFGSDDQRRACLATSHVARVLPVLRPRDLLRDLRQVQRLIASRVPLSAESRVAAGQRVRVRHGALGGLEGTLLKRCGETRLLVRVACLPQAASVAIDDGAVEVL